MLLRLELQSDPEMLCAVRGALTHLAERLGFSEEDCRAVVLAVDEALTNIIRHTYGGQTEKPIHAEFRRSTLDEDGLRGDALEIVLEDEGPAVDREKLCGREFGDIRPGGLGLHFIRQSMDRVEFRRRNDRNQLRLVKLFRKKDA
jgi:anti-sigma regulatory factor (Ser/Thr protein kinase)